MGSQRLTRVDELLHREIGSALYRILTDQAIDLSTVTITRVSTAPDLRQARVMISIRSDAEQQVRTMRALRKRRAEIQQEVAKHVVLKYMPRFMFVLDASVADGHRVLELLDDLADEVEEEDHDETSEE